MTEHYGNSAPPPKVTSLDDLYNEKEASMREHLEHHKLRAMIEAAKMVRPAPDPTLPLRETIRRRDDQIDNLKRQMGNITEGIRRDLKLIRSKCTDCDCHPDIPAGNCPHMVMHKSMAALVNNALDDLKDD